MPDYFGAVYAADPHESGSFIISEANFYRSRGRVTIAAGAGQLAFGTVLGRISSSGLYVPSPASATDGSDIACAILFEDTDASGAANVAAGVIAREAEVFAGALTFDPSVADAAAHRRLEGNGTNNYER
jgi:head decoration protein D